MGGGRASLTLSDGSTLDEAPSSKLNFVQGLLADKKRRAIVAAMVVGALVASVILLLVLLGV